MGAVPVINVVFAVLCAALGCLHGFSGEFAKGAYFWSMATAGFVMGMTR